MMQRIRYLFLACCLFAGPLQAAWQIETVDPGGGGKFTSLLFDKNGNAHASYVSESLHQLRYAFWDHTLQKWFVMVVDNHCGGFASMALDSHQYPHIVYQPYGASGIQYAHWDGSSWRIETVHITARLSEYYVSIALTSQDYPIITYYEVLGPDGNEFVLHLCSVQWNGRYWQNTTVDWTPGSGKFNSVACGAHGDIGIAYANVKYENASLRYAHWNGHKWDLNVLEGAAGPYPIYSVSLVLDRRDAPHLTYTDVANHVVKYATLADGHWQMQAVGTIEREAFPDRNGITLDQAGHPYITYYDAGLGVLKLAYMQHNRWVSELVDQTYSGFTSSVQVNDGEIFIIYFDVMSDSLKCARRSLGATAVNPELSASNIVTK